MSYDDAPADGPENPGLLTITMIVVAGLVLIVGCAGIYFFVGRGRPAVTQGTTVIEVTKIPSLTPSLTAIPTETLAPTLQEGLGGGGLDTDTPVPIPAIRYATLGEVKGTVQIKNLALVDWTTVTTELTIPSGTTILTSENSSVKVTLTEGTIIRVGSQTQVTLTDMSGNTLDPVTKLTLDFGKVWSIVGNSLGAGKYEIDTPLGTASVLDSFMSTEHNTTVPLDIITCLFGHCRYKNGFGVQDLFDDEQLQSDGTGAPPAPEAMDANQAADWNLTKVPEVVTLTPSSTPTATATNTRTPSNTPGPTNTPNATSTAAQATSNAQATNNQATSNVQSTNNAGTSTSQAQVSNQTATVFFFNATATAMAGSTQNSFTATSFSFTATAFNATSNANGTNSVLTATAALTQTAAANATNSQNLVNATNTQAANNATGTAAAATATQAAIPVVQFSSSTTSVNESDGGGTGGNANKTVANLTVNMSPTSNANVTVNYSFTNGTATGAGALATTGSADYDNTGTSITISAGQTSGTIVVPIADDGFSEGSENFTVTINSLTTTGNAVLGTSKTNVVTINNTAPPSVSFSPSTPSVTEAGTATITISGSRAVYQPFTYRVSYETTTGGTATAGGTDYTAVATTQTGDFQPGTQTQTFSVVTAGDSLDEANETVNLLLSAPTNGATLGTSAGTLTITDDDPTPNLTYTVSSAGGATPTEPGTIGTTLTLVIDFTLSTVSGQDVSFNYATAAGTATDGLDYTGASGTKTILAGATTAQIQITINGDALNEAAENFSVTFTSVTNATLTSSNPLTIAITDDGDPQPTASFSAAPYQVTEGNSGTTTATITVNLNRQSGQQIQIAYTHSDTGSCTNKTSDTIDYTFTNGTLTFNAGDLSKTFTVSVIGDTTDTTHECFTMTLSSGSAVTLSPATSELWIMNDD